MQVHAGRTSHGELYNLPPKLMQLSRQLRMKPNSRLIRSHRSVTAIASTLEPRTSLLPPLQLPDPGAMIVSSVSEEEEGMWDPDR